MYRLMNVVTTLAALAVLIGWHPGALRHVSEFDIDLITLGLLILSQCYGIRADMEERKR